MKPGNPESAFTIMPSRSLMGLPRACKKSSLDPPVSAPIRDLALAGQDRQALADLERLGFTRKKLELAIDGIRLCLSAASTVTPVALQMMSFPFVGQLNIKNVFQATNQLGAADRKEDFDSMTQVPSHEVGAAEINLLGPSVPEIVDAAVL